MSIKTEVCIVCAGNVDSGKSTLIGVLTSGTLDDGNGSARKTVSRHKHELDSGKTSDITMKTINVSNDKNINLVDLCGHETYLKTTLYGITGYYPDYGIIVIAANRGLLKMTKEHLGIYLYLKIPFIIVITRIDLVSDNPAIYEKTMSSIKRILKKYNRQTMIINSNKELKIMENEDELKNKYEEHKQKTDKILSIMTVNNNITPIITISNKTGYYIDVIKYLISNLSPRKIWDDSIKKNDNTIFYIDAKYTPKGVGLVITGLNRGDPIKVGDELLLGPYGKNFIPIKVWSIHDNYRQTITELSDKLRGCLAIRILDKKIKFGAENIRKGMVVVSKQSDLHNVCFQFEAKISILNHSTSIKNNYTPVIHCGSVRQSAKLKIIYDKEYLKLGDDAIVIFRFIAKPEYLEEGALFFFREGTTRGVGKIEKILPLIDDPDKEPALTDKKKENKFI
jgi:elongation factor 1-alpha